MSTLTKAVMIDLETLGTTPTSSILSIGAVVFTVAGNIDDVSTDFIKFYSTVDIASCQEYGLTIDAHTVRWWIQQSDEAKKELISSGGSLPHVINLFSDWWDKSGFTKDTPLWCHGPSFDAVVLENAFKAIGYTIPWSYNAPRDTRTIYDLAELDVKTQVRSGVFHNALDDCIFQVRMVQKAWRMIVGWESMNKVLVTNLSQTTEK
jgi:hypothetical protein